MKKIKYLLFTCLLLSACTRSTIEDNKEYQHTTVSGEQTNTIVPTTSTVTSTVTMPECSYEKNVKMEYSINEKKIRMSSTIGKIDNIAIEPDNENDVLNFYFVYCDVKYLITSLQFISTENYDLANVEIEEPLRSYLDDNGLCIYKTISDFFVIGVDYNYLLNEGLQDFNKLYNEEITNEYSKTLNQLFGLNDFNEIDGITDYS